MERRLLLQSLVAALVIEPGKILLGTEPQETTSSANRKDGLLVHFAENRNRAGASNDHWLISGKDTGGALGIVGPQHPPDHQPPPGRKPPANYRGIPLHIHYHQDEFWYVIQGELLVQVGDKKFHAKPGDLVFGPRGVPHSPRGLGPVAILGMWQPAGTMEEFFHELAEAERNAGDKFPGPDVLAALFKAHGMEIVGPPVQP